MQSHSFNRQRAGYQTAMDAQDIKFGAIRVTNMKALLREADGNIPALAIAVDMSPQRLRDALDGLSPIGRELAMHIENALGLAPSWLDHKASERPEVTAEAAARIRAAVNGEDILRDEEGSDVTVHQEVKIPETGDSASSAAAQPETTSEGLFGRARKRIARKQPVVAVKAQRRVEGVSDDDEGAGFVFGEESGELKTAADSGEVKAEDGAANAASAPSAPRRGRRPGQISISPELQALRLERVRELTSQPGSKARLCRLMGMPDSYVSHLVAGRRTITDSIAEKLVEALKLPKDYFALDGSSIESPQALIQDLTADKSAKPVVVKVSKTIVQDTPIRTGAQKSTMPNAAELAATTKLEAPATPSPEVGTKEHLDGDVATLASVQARAAKPAAEHRPITQASAATKVDVALTAAINAMLNRAVIEGKLDNRRATEVLRVLAEALDS